VQVLYDFNDESALKLTIAKYLTPGDVSIQEVGIIPDIALTPTRVTAERVDVFAPRRSMGEADLDHHFASPQAKEAAKKREEVLGRESSAFELKYLKEDPKQKDASAKAQLQEEGRSPKVTRAEPKEKKKHGEKDPLLDVDLAGVDEDLDDQLDAEAQDEIKEDFEVLFARDFVLKAPHADRLQMLKAAKPFIAERRRQEEERISAALTSLGVDWSEGPSPKAAQLAATLKPGPDAKIVAGELLELELTVENRGAEPLRRLRAWTDSPNIYVDRREFVFGALAPKEKRTWKVPVRLPMDLTSRRDEITVKFFDDGGPLADSLVSELAFVELPRPAFAFNWQVLDDCAQCNGDGLIQRGEKIDLVLDIINRGQGKALDAFAQIKNAADSNIFIEKGRWKLGELAPGQSRTARFSLEVRKGFKDDEFPLKLAIIDEKLEEFVSDKLSLPVAKPIALEAKKQLVKLGANTQLYGAPDESSRPLTKLSKPALLSSTAANEGFLRVDLEKDRFAFVRAADARPAKGRAALARELAPLAFRDPPQIALSADPAQGGVVVDGDRFLLSGTVTSPKSLLDMYVLVNDQKVLFKSAGASADEAGAIPFSTELPLKEGNNNVMVVARESQDFASRKSLVIRRRTAQVAQKLAPTPAARQ
jgi:carboxyl-terminal processing protease